MIKSKRLTFLEKASFVLSKDKKEIIVGCLLGDVYIQKQSGSLNARLMFRQGLVHEAYLLHLFDLFKGYSSFDQLNEQKHSLSLKSTKKIYTTKYFYTRSLPCFNQYYELFYLDGKKIVPKIIGELFTAKSLAYLCCDDGSKQKDNFVLCTESFNKDDNLLLIQTLKDNFGLNCTLQKTNSTEDKIKYRIYIKSDSIFKFKQLVKPYFIPSMLYKLD